MNEERREARRAANARTAEQRAALTRRVAAMDPVRAQLSEAWYQRLSQEQRDAVKLYYTAHQERLRACRIPGVYDPGRLHPAW